MTTSTPSNPSTCCASTSAQLTVVRRALADLLDRLAKMNAPIFGVPDVCVYVEPPLDDRELRKDVEAEKQALRARLDLLAGTSTPVTEMMRQLVARNLATLEILEETTDRPVDEPFPAAADLRHKVELRASQLLAGDVK